MTFKNSSYLDKLNPLFLIWFPLFIPFSELFWPVFLVLCGIKLVTAKIYLHLQIFRGQVFTIDTSCVIYWICYRWILWYYHILSISNLFTAFINNRCWILLKRILLLFQIAVILNIFSVRMIYYTYSLHVSNHCICGMMLLWSWESFCSLLFIWLSGTFLWCIISLM